jgi:hypothetical protein
MKQCCFYVVILMYSSISGSNKIRSLTYTLFRGRPYTAVEFTLARPNCKCGNLLPPHFHIHKD